MDQIETGYVYVIRNIIIIKLEVGSINYINQINGLSLYSHLIDMVSADFANRPMKKLVLFDVDGTLTPARKVCFLKPRTIVQNIF